MESLTETLRAARGGKKVVIEASVVETGRGFVVRERRTLRHTAWYLFWLGAEVTTVETGPYATFRLAARALKDAMQLHAKNWEGGAYLTQQRRSFSGSSAP